MSKAGALGLGIGPASGAERFMVRGVPQRTDDQSDRNLVRLACSLDLLE